MHNWHRIALFDLHIQCEDAQRRQRQPSYVTLMAVRKNRTVNQLSLCQLSISIFYVKRLHIIMDDKKLQTRARRRKLFLELVQYKQSISCIMSDIQETGTGKKPGLHRRVGNSDKGISGLWQVDDPASQKQCD